MHHYLKQIIYLLISFTILVSCSDVPYSKNELINFTASKLSPDKELKLLMENAETTDKVDYYHSLSKLYADNKDWGLAKSSIENAIEIEPLNAAFHARKATYCYNLGLEDEANNEALIAEELGYYSLSHNVMLATFLNEKHQFQKSYKLTSQLIEEGIDNIDIEYLHAKNLLGIGDTVKSLSTYKMLLKDDTTNYKQMFELAHLYKAMSQDSLALDYVFKLIENSAQYVLAYDEFYAQLLIDKNEIDSALLVYKRMYAFKPDSVYLMALLDIYQEQEDYNSVLHYADLALTNGANENHIRLIKARAYDNLYQYENAVAEYMFLVAADSLDSIVVAELNYVQRKIAYLRKKQEERQQIADSLSNFLTPLLN